MSQWYRPLALAFVFLTRIPMPKIHSLTPEDEGRSLLCFPLVGLALGVLLCALAMVIAPAFSSLVTAAIVLAFWAAVTGGIHLDGLADSADGWLGGYGDPERTLEIMHDSRCGSGALVTVVCLLILKFAALTVIVEQQLWSALLIAPIIGRCVGPLLFLKGGIFYAPYVQPSGIAKHFIEHCPPYAQQLSYGAIVLCGLLMGSITNAVIILALCAGMMLLLRRLMLKRLGGATGDTAGASTEILETVLLLACGVILC